MTPNDPYLARRRFGHSAKAVAAALGYSDSSSVSHALKRIEAGPPKLRQALTRIEERLR